MRLDGGLLEKPGSDQRGADPRHDNGYQEHQQKPVGQKLSGMTLSCVGLSQHAVLAPDPEATGAQRINQLIDKERQQDPAGDNHLDRAAVHPAPHCAAIDTFKAKRDPIVRDVCIADQKSLPQSLQ
jgi:hypothetical protein